MNRFQDAISLVAAHSRRLFPLVALAAVVFSATSNRFLSTKLTTSHHLPTTSFSWKSRCRGCAAVSVSFSLSALLRGRVDPPPASGSASATTSYPYAFLGSSSLSLAWCQLVLLSVTGPIGWSICKSRSEPKKASRRIAHSHSIRDGFYSVWQFSRNLGTCKGTVNTGADTRQDFCRDSTLPVCNVRGPIPSHRGRRLGLMFLIAFHSMATTTGRTFRTVAGIRRLSINRHRSEWRKASWKPWYIPERAS